MLSQTDIERYRAEGYVVPDYRVPEDLLDGIRVSHDRLIARHPEFEDYCPALLALDAWFLNVGRIPEIVDMVEQLIGPDIALWNSSFFAKPARKGSRTPWHQDGSYWPIRPLATCSVWIAVDPSTTENGCLRVLPGSHRRRRLMAHGINGAEGLACRSNSPIRNTTNRRRVTSCWNRGRCPCTMYSWRTAPSPIDRIGPGAA